MSHIGHIANHLAWPHVKANNAVEVIVLCKIVIQQHRRGRLVLDHGLSLATLLAPSPHKDGSIPDLHDWNGISMAD